MADGREWRKVGKMPGELPTGVIVGSAEIAGCTERRDREGVHYAYALVSPRRLRTPIVPVNQPQPRFWRPQFKAE